MKREKVLRTILSVTLAAFLLCGCGNSTDETTTSEDVPEVVEPVEAPDTEEKEEVTKPAEEQEENKQEEVVEEPTEETEEVTYITDYGSLEDFMSKLDPNNPAIVIYNDSEKYIVNIEDGQHYQMKKGDRIFLNIIGSSVGKYGYNLDVVYGDTNDSISSEIGVELLCDYKKFQKDQELWLKMKTEDGQILQITCYLTAPAE